MPQRVWQRTRQLWSSSDSLCAGIDRNSWAGHSVTFCSPQRALWRPERKASKTLYFYVPVLELEELLSMKGALPAYKVRHTEPYLRACWITVCEQVCLRVLPVVSVLIDYPCAEPQ